MQQSLLIYGVKVFKRYRIKWKFKYVYKKHFNPKIVSNLLFAYAKR